MAILTWICDTVIHFILPLPQHSGRFVMSHRLYRTILITAKVPMLETKILMLVGWRILDLLLSLKQSVHFSIRLLGISTTLKSGSVMYSTSVNFLLKCKHVFLSMCARSYCLMSNYIVCKILRRIFLAFIGVTNLKNLNNELELPYRMKIFTGIGILLLSWLTRHYMNLDSTFGQILQS